MKFDQLPADQLEEASKAVNTMLEVMGKTKLSASLSEVLAEYNAKRCGVCKQLKHLEEFPKKASRRDGLRNECKACHITNAASYREANPEYHHEYHQANRSRISEYRHSRYQDPNDDFRIQKQLRSGYSRAVAAGNTAERVTPDELYEFWSLIGIDPWKCYLTGEKLDHLTRSIDHVVPISEGGSHTPANLMPATKTANVNKRNQQAGEVISAESQRDVSTTASTNNKENQ